MEQPGRGRVLACYYTARSEPPATAELRAQLAEQLPEALVPSFFACLPHLPLNLNGKVDRRALPRPEELVYQHIPYVAPEGAVETTLAAIWSEVLGLAKVGVNNPFLELGGTSLAAIRVLGFFFR